MTKLTWRFNEALGNASVSISNDGIHDTLINATFTTKVEVKKLLVYVSIRLPESRNDEQYKREFLKTTFDVEKLFNGIFSNVLGRSFMENFRSSANFELKLPLKTVSEIEVKYFQT